LTSAASQWDVVGIGENSVDLVARLPALPQPRGAGKVRIESRHLSCGGQAATAMCACAALGLRVKYVGATGMDEYGRLIRDELRRRSVDTTDVVTREAATRFAIVLVNQSDGERLVLWDWDQRLQLDKAELPTDALTSTRVLHVDDTDIAIAVRAAGIARAAGALVTSDIDTVTRDTTDLVGAVTHAIFSEHVPLRLTGRNDLADAMHQLAARHDSVLCVTMGPHGSMAVEQGRTHYVPSFAVDAVDTTGAGDVFRAGFIYALLQNMSIEQTLRFANGAAALSCTRAGAISGVPTLAEVNALLTGAMP
jgi:sugar/nucleoside kinase (ribokinase family)